MKTITMKQLAYACLISMQLTNFSTAAAGPKTGDKKGTGGGGMAGGGGDPTEIRFDEVRADILTWINRGGAQSLYLQDTTYSEYVDKMTEILAAKKVIVGFIENDHPTDEELQVIVNGIPKTCRGFVSRKDSMPHILCNISRFKEAQEAEHYKLVHHEYAGLVGLESNEGAASDYNISKQLTSFLKREMVLKLAVKKSSNNSTEKDPRFVISKYKYNGKDQIDLSMKLEESQDVMQVFLIRDRDESYCKDLPAQKVMMNGKFDYNLDINLRECLTVRFDAKVQKDDGSLVSIMPIFENFGFNRMKDKSINIIKVNRSVLDVKIENDKYVKGIKEKTIVESLTYDVSANDLHGYIGVRFSNGDELMSEDPLKLAAFINSREHKDETYWSQNTKSQGYMCGLFRGDCLIRNNKTLDSFGIRSVSGGEQVTKRNILLFKKGNITKADYVTFDLRTAIEK